MDLLLTVISWVLFVFYMMLGVGMISSYVGWLFLAQAVLVMPVRPILNLWREIGKVKPVKYLVMVLLLCLSVWQMPSAAERVAQAKQMQAEEIQEEAEQNAQQILQDSVEPEEMQPISEVLKQDTAEEAGREQAALEEAEPEQDAAEQSPEEQPAEEETEFQDLTVHFVDVGQGDCTLLVCGKDAMLIDAGEDACGTEVQKYLQDHGISKLKYVVCTHPDADHIGAMDVILYKFDCETIFMTDAAKETGDFREIKNVMSLKSYNATSPVVGAVYTLGSASFQIISPALAYAESNNNSIVLRVDHKNKSFLFTGDAEVQAQQEMYYSGYKIRADVLKVPHHGANSGLQGWFLAEVAPSYAVISCGKENAYGHPHGEILEALRQMGISVYRTDEQGTIIAKSDGYTITFDQEPSTTWQPGTAAGKNASNENEDDDKNSSEAQAAAAFLRNLPEGLYVVNGSNGKIHIKGKCPATDPDASSHMNNPVPCNSYELAEDASFRVDSEITEDRRCKICFP